MRKLFTVFLLSITLTGCLRMDDFLFANDSTIESYQFDTYGGKKELPELPVSYSIADSMRHLFTVQSSNADGTAKIYAVYLGDMNKIATDTVILYCHGNTDHMDRYWNRAKILAYTGHAHRFGVLMFDYRGYGLSEGKPSEKNIYADADAAIKWLKEKGLSDNRLIVYGYSLGTSVATEVTANSYSLKPSKLILENPFASSEVMIQDGSILALPASYFLNAKIDNANKIGKVTQPFMWMHGTADAFLSIETHGEVVWKNYKGIYGNPFRVKDATHNNLPLVMDFNHYSDELLRFITH